MLIPRSNDYQKYSCVICTCFRVFTWLFLAQPWLDLQQRTHTYDTTKISRIVNVRYIGYLVGTVLDKILFNHLNHSCLIGVFLLLTAVGMTLAPWWQQLSRLMACISLVGVSMGLLDTGERNTEVEVVCIHCCVYYS